MDEPCTPAGKPPNIILLLDEASFDARAVPGIKLPAGYGAHFVSFDGKERKLFVEGSGGPTWYTEYNVLTGLSARSYGRLSYYVTRIAAGRVKRGLPQELRRCGYKTISLYPAYGAFLSAKKFQTTAGIRHFFDSADMKAGDFEPDSFYFDQALKTMAAEQDGRPQFVMIYTMFNHFPWWNTLKPELTPDWKPPGNDPQLDEYLRRQSLSASDYAAFKARLAKEFPGQPFLIVRFGDHQPGMAQFIDPAATEEMIAQRIMSYDPRYFTTYYAIDGVNFTPKDVSSALDRLEAPYHSPCRAGGGRPAARSVVRRAEENPAALPRPVLSVRRRRRGAPLQPAADRRRVDQGNGVPLVCRAAGAPPARGMA